MLPSTLTRFPFPDAWMLIIFPPLCFAVGMVLFGSLPSFSKYRQHLFELPVYIFRVIIVLYFLSSFIFYLILTFLFLIRFSFSLVDFRFSLACINFKNTLLLYNKVVPPPKRCHIVKAHWLVN